MQRGVSIKATPLTVVMQDTREKSYLLNLCDTPGCSFRFINLIIKFYLTLSIFRTHKLRRRADVGVQSLRRRFARRRRARRRHDDDRTSDQARAAGN